MSEDLKVTHLDNRSGDPDNPYGFIYFNDDRRIVYAGTEVHDSTRGWAPITSTHKALAEAFLQGYHELRERLKSE